MMVRDKKGSTQKRVIVDLSWPIGRSVNANIPIDMYEGVPATMKLPTPMDLAQAIITAPPTAHLFSLDLSRAYRQLRVDPQEWPLLGLTWNKQYYFDLSLAFGGRWHAAACQRVTEALQFYLGQPRHQSMALPRRHSRAGRRPNHGHQPLQTSQSSHVLARPAGGHSQGN